MTARNSRKKPKKEATPTKVGVRRSTRKRHVSSDESDVSSAMDTSVSKAESKASPSPSEELWPNIGETKEDDDLIVNRVNRRKQLARELIKKRKHDDRRRAQSVDLSTVSLRSLLQESESFIEGVLARSNSKAKAKNSKKKKETSKRSRRPTEDEEDPEENVTRLSVQPSLLSGATLKNYQLEGLNWLISLYENGLNGILADEMGLGKTIQTITLFAYLKEFRSIDGPHLVLAPKSTLGNWLSEINRFCPALKAFKFHGTKDEREQMKLTAFAPGAYDVYITSYELCVREKNLLQKMRWRYLVIDEAHRIKNEASKLSQVTRTFRTEFRLLLTGTPLQNNLHELWSLLNFLFPEIFASSEEFESVFDLTSQDDTISQSDREAKNAEIVTRLHKILRPFMLRRVKVEVTVDLPPKKELLLYIPLSQMQKQLYRALLAKNADAAHDGAGVPSRSRLMNLAMQLRKACNHPYLFEGYEEPNADPFGEHLIKNSGKMTFIDRLLTRLIASGSRVLIFSQMTRMLDILDDYCRLRYFKYCRIDGSTSGHDRDAAIEGFNTPNSEIAVFLLSTRAGGLGINLTAADTVVLFDSDWNPQVDLQAMDRAHRIGQTRPVNVYRLIHEHTIEEKVLEKATMKLQLDSAVIQQGGYSSKNRHLAKGELMSMVQYGADRIFKAGVSMEDLSEADFNLILQRGEQKHVEINNKLQAHVKKRLLDFSQSTKEMNADYLAEIFSGNIDTEEARMEKEAWLAMAAEDLEEQHSKRKARAEQNRMEQVMKQALKSQKVQQTRLPPMQEWQFYPREKLLALHDEEFELIQARFVAEENGEDSDVLTARLLDVKEHLQDGLAQGFGDWSRRDFQAFVRGCEIHGRNDLREINLEIGPHKTPRQVQAYSSAFWKHIENLPDGKRIVARITTGEVGIDRRLDIEKIIRLKQTQCRNPWQEAHLAGWSQSSVRKLFNETEDRWLLNIMAILGYGLWDRYRVHARCDSILRYDWYLQSRSAVEFNRRAETLVRQLKKEASDTGRKRRTTISEGDKKRRKTTQGSRPETAESVLPETPITEPTDGEKLAEGSQVGIVEEEEASKSEDPTPLEAPDDDISL